MSELREPANRVDPRARSMWTVTAALQLLVVLTGLAVGAYVWDELTWLRWAVAVVFVLGIALVAAVPRWRYHLHRWEITDNAVYTQVGVWSRERRIAPLSRVQTVDLAQGPVSRLFGLAAVTVTTASAAGPLTIAALDRGLAEQVIDDLTTKADLVEGDAT